MIDQEHYDAAKKGHQDAPEIEARNSMSAKCAEYDAEYVRIVHGDIRRMNASIFAALGTRVTIVGGGSHLLPSLDVEMAGVLAECFNSMGIRVIPTASISHVARGRGGLEVRLSDGHELQVEKILVAAGRRPQIEGLGLTQAGVELDSSGWVRVDDHYQTSVAGVFAAGDVIGPPGLAAVAMEQAGCRLPRLRLRLQERDASLSADVHILHPRGSLGRLYRGAGARVRYQLRGGPMLL